MQCRVRERVGVRFPSCLFLGGLDLFAVLRKEGLVYVNFVQRRVQRRVGGTLLRASSEKFLDEEHKDKASLATEHDESLRPWFAEGCAFPVNADRY